MLKNFSNNSGNGEKISSTFEYEDNDVVFMVILPSELDGNGVYWSRNNQRSLSNDRFKPYNTRNRSSLMIRQVTSNDAGNYCAELEDGYGTTRLASIDLNVEKRLPRVPFFLRRLNDASVKVGSRIRFLVEIDSVVSPKITWYHDNRLIKKNERVNFLEENKYFCMDIAWTVLQDEGHWTCIAENKYGCSVSSAYLTILVPKAYKSPQFAEELNVVLAEDGSVSLECKVRGVPTPTLHWYKDGKKITAGDIFALRVDSTNCSSLGTYSCVAKNCLGQAFSSSIVRFHKNNQNSTDNNIFPLGPQPKFLRELRNVEVHIESPLTLSCQVVVPPWPKTIDWYNKNGKIVENEKYKMIADGLGMYVLKIKNVELIDDGEWKCLATSFFGIKAFTSCYVTVKFPKNYKSPKFLENLRAIMTSEGLVSFECKVLGYPAPQLKWLKDDKELKPGDVYQLTGTNSLGMYCCIAKNSMGEMKSTTVLTLEDIRHHLTEEEKLMIFSKNHPPYFIKGLTSQELKINEEFKFHVQVNAKCEPKIFWYRNDEIITENERISIYKESHGNFWLYVKILEFKDQAEWKCVAINDYGQSVTSCFVKLIIPKHYKAPRFLEELKVDFTKEGVVNLECKVIGVPQPELRWYKDGRRLKSGEIHKIISGVNGTCYLGTYSCEAINCMATVCSSASLLAFEDKKDDKLSSNITKNCTDILSIITEERSSQLNNSTILSDKSVTFEEAVGVSFSFDGKEVSISLYETPNLTEEEALQVVEMYANELTERISEQNVVELPSLRFVKETIISRNILMEATLVDVPINECSEEEFKTDADIENSMMDDSAFVTNNSLNSDDLSIDKNISDFSHDIIQSSQSCAEESLTEKLVKIKSGYVPFNTIENEDDNVILDKEHLITDKINVKENFTECMTKNTLSISRESLSKRKSFDSEDDSLHEFEKLKTLKMRKTSDDIFEEFKNSKQLNTQIYNHTSDTESDEIFVPRDSNIFENKKQLSVLEIISFSANTIERNLNKIHENVASNKITENTDHILFVLQSLLKPIREIKNNLSRENDNLRTSKTSITETLFQPLTEFQTLIVNMEELLEHDENQQFHKIIHSVLNAIAEPFEEINRGLNLIEIDILENQSNEILKARTSTTDISDLRNMIFILNEYTKKSKDFLFLIEQKKVDSIPYISERFNNTLKLTNMTQKWYVNAIQELECSDKIQNDLIDFNRALIQYLNTNLVIMRKISKTSDNFEYFCKFLDETSSADENLNVTFKIIENLAPSTSVKYLCNAFKNYSDISEHLIENELFETSNINPYCILKSICDSTEIILNTLDMIEKCSKEEVSNHDKSLFFSFHKLQEPMQILLTQLRIIEKQILLEEKFENKKLKGKETHELINNISDLLHVLKNDMNRLGNNFQIRNTEGAVDDIIKIIIPALNNSQNAISIFHKITLSKECENADLNFALSALNNLNVPLCELADKMMEAKEQILRESSSVSIGGIRIVTQAISSLIDAIADLQDDSFKNHSISLILSKLSDPLIEVKSCLENINDQFYENTLDKINITMVRTLSDPFNSLQKELINAAEIVTGDLKYAILELQRSILTIQDQVSFEYGDEPVTIEYNITTLQTLLKPTNILKNHCIAIKNNSNFNKLSLIEYINKIENEQIKIIDQIEYILISIHKNQIDLSIANSMQSIALMMKNYKNLIIVVKTISDENNLRSDTLHHDVEVILKQLRINFESIQQNQAILPDLLDELQNLMHGIDTMKIDDIKDASSFISKLKHLTHFNSIFGEILSTLKILSGLDVQEDDSMKCFIALLQSLNTIRTLQDNVKHFQNSSNTDSIQVPMLSSFLNTCEKLEINISDLFFVVENVAERATVLNPQFYQYAMRAFSILNKQLIHLNKCLIDQSMSDDDQKEIPFESSINEFNALLETVTNDKENTSLKQMRLIITDGILNEIIKLKNDILFNMSLIQTDDEVSFNGSDQSEQNLISPNPDLYIVCVENMKKEIKKCEKSFEKINKSQFQQKIKYIDDINTNLENIFNIINFIKKNTPFEDTEEHLNTNKLYEPVLQILRQVRQIKNFSNTLNNGELLGLNTNLNKENLILSLLVNLQQTFDKFKLLAIPVTVFVISRSQFAVDNNEFWNEFDSDDEAESSCNDTSSATVTVDFATIIKNDELGFQQRKKNCTINSTSTFSESSSLNSDIFNDKNIQNIRDEKTESPINNAEEERESECDHSLKNSIDKNKTTQIEETSKFDENILDFDEKTQTNKLNLLSTSEKKLKALDADTKNIQNIIKFHNCYNEGMIDNAFEYNYEEINTNMENEVFKGITAFIENTIQLSLETVLPSSINIEEVTEISKIYQEHPEATIKNKINMNRENIIIIEPELKFESAEQSYLSTPSQQTVSEHVAFKESNEVNPFDLNTEMLLNWSTLKNLKFQSENCNVQVEENKMRSQSENIEDVDTTVNITKRDLKLNTELDRTLLPFPIVHRDGNNDNVKVTKDENLANAISIEISLVQETNNDFMDLLTKYEEINSYNVTENLTENFHNGLKTHPNVMKIQENSNENLDDEIEFEFMEQSILRIEPELKITKGNEIIPKEINEKFDLNKANKIMSAVVADKCTNSFVSKTDIIKINDKFENLFEQNSENKFNKCCTNDLSEFSSINEIGAINDFVGTFKPQSKKNEESEIVCHITKSLSEGSIHNELVVNDEITEEYWDTLEDECVSECSKNHIHQRIKSTFSEGISEKESFETALDDTFEDFSDVENTDDQIFPVYTDNSVQNLDENVIANLTLENELIDYETILNSNIEKKISKISQLAPVLHNEDKILIPNNCLKECDQEEYTTLQIKHDNELIKIDVPATFATTQILENEFTPIEENLETICFKQNKELERGLNFVSNNQITSSCCTEMVLKHNSVNENLENKNMDIIFKAENEKLAVTHKIIGDLDEIKVANTHVLQDPFENERRNKLNDELLKTIEEKKSFINAKQVNRIYEDNIAGNLINNIEEIVNNNRDYDQYTEKNLNETEKSAIQIMSISENHLLEDVINTPTLMNTEECHSVASLQSIHKNKNLNAKIQEGEQCETDDNVNNFFDIIDDSTKKTGYNSQDEKNLEKNHLFSSHFEQISNNIESSLIKSEIFSPTTDSYKTNLEQKLKMEDDLKVSQNNEKINQFEVQIYSKNEDLEEYNDRAAVEHILCLKNDEELKQRNFYEKFEEENVDDFHYSSNEKQCFIEYEIQEFNDYNLKNTSTTDIEFSSVPNELFAVNDITSKGNVKLDKNKNDLNLDVFIRFASQENDTSELIPHNNFIFNDTCYQYVTDIIENAILKEEPLRTSIQTTDEFDTVIIHEGQTSFNFPQKCVDNYFAEITGSDNVASKIHTKINDTNLYVKFTEDGIESQPKIFSQSQEQTIYDEAAQEMQDEYVDDIMKISHFKKKNNAQEMILLEQASNKLEEKCNKNVSETEKEEEAITNFKVPCITENEISTKLKDNDQIYSVPTTKNVKSIKIYSDEESEVDFIQDNKILENNEEVEISQTIKKENKEVNFKQIQNILTEKHDFSELPNKNIFSTVCGDSVSVTIDNTESKFSNKNMEKFSLTLFPQKLQETLIENFQSKAILIENTDEEFFQRTIFKECEVESSEEKNKKIFSKIENYNIKETSEINKQETEINKEKEKAENEVQLKTINQEKNDRNNFNNLNINNIDIAQFPIEKFNSETEIDNFKLNKSNQNEAYVNELKSTNIEIISDFEKANITEVQHESIKFDDIDKFQPYCIINISDRPEIVLEICKTAENEEEHVDTENAITLEESEKNHQSLLNLKINAEDEKEESRIVAEKNANVNQLDDIYMKVQDSKKIFVKEDEIKYDNFEEIDQIRIFGNNLICENMDECSQLILDQRHNTGKFTTNFNELTCSEIDENTIFIEKENQLKMAINENQARTRINQLETIYINLQESQMTDVKIESAKCIQTDELHAFDEVKRVNLSKNIMFYEFHSNNKLKKKLISKTELAIGEQKVSSKEITNNQNNKDKNQKKQTIIQNNECVQQLENTCEETEEFKNMEIKEERIPFLIVQNMDQMQSYDAVKCDDLSKINVFKYTETEIKTDVLPLKLKEEREENIEKKVENDALISKQSTRFPLDFKLKNNDRANILTLKKETVEIAFTQRADIKNKCDKDTNEFLSKSKVCFEDLRNCIKNQSSTENVETNIRTNMVELKNANIKLKPIESDVIKNENEPQNTKLKIRSTTEQLKTKQFLAKTDSKIKEYKQKNEGDDKKLFPSMFPSALASKISNLERIRSSEFTDDINSSIKLKTDLSEIMLSSRQTEIMLQEFAKYKDNTKYSKYTIEKPATSTLKYRPAHITKDKEITRIIDKYNLELEINKITTDFLNRELILRERFYDFNKFSKLLKYDNRKNVNREIRPIVACSIPPTKYNRRIRTSVNDNFTLKLIKYFYDTKNIDRHFFTKIYTKQPFLKFYANRNLSRNFIYDSDYFMQNQYLNRSLVPKVDLMKFKNCNSHHEKYYRSDYFEYIPFLQCAQNMNFKIKIPRYCRDTEIISSNYLRNEKFPTHFYFINYTPLYKNCFNQRELSNVICTKQGRTCCCTDLRTLVVSSTSCNENGKVRTWNKYEKTDVSDNTNITNTIGREKGKPPIFLSRPDTIMWINSGSDVSVSFRLLGDPKPKVLWMKGIMDITESQRTLKETVNDYTRLTLKRAQLSDAGTYFIIAKNKHGTDRAFFTLRVNQRHSSLTPMPLYKHYTNNFYSNDNDNRRSNIYMHKVPGIIPDDPYVSEIAKNRITLTWSKPMVCGSAPVLAYLVENWEIGANGGAKWNELGSTTTTSFDVYNLEPNKKYNFRIKARNQYGWGETRVTSSPITIESLAEFPEFDKYLPGELKVLLGSSIELECKLKQETGVQIQWYRDGIRIEENELIGTKYENGRCLLKIEYLEESHSGRYVCEAFNAQGKVCTFTRLTVVTDPKIADACRRLNRLRHENEGKIDMAPQFTMRLRNRRVQIFYPVRLTCQIIGYPKPVVLWLKNEEILKKNEFYSLYNEADNFYSLEINRAMCEHAGTYSVVATNSAGTVSCKCDLIVDKGLRTYVSPIFIKKLDKVYSIVEGSQLRIRALIQAYPAVEVSWQKNGMSLRTSRQIIVTLSHEGEIELTIAQIRQRDNGIYTCTAVNEIGKAETNTRIEVYPKCNLKSELSHEELSHNLYSKEPKFLMKPRSCDAVEEDHVIIECQIIGDPKPNVLWLRDSLKLDYYRDSDEFKLSSEESTPFIYKLEIPRVKFHHIGAYTIIAKNEHGEAKAIVSLQVYSRGTKKKIEMKEEKTKYCEVETIPKIRRHLSDIKCCEGDSVTFELEVNVERNLSDVNFHWYKNEKLISLGEDFMSIVHGNVANFIIKKVYPEDEGQYSCIVSNNLGSATSAACLIVNASDGKENVIHGQLRRPLTNNLSPILNDKINVSKEYVISEQTNYLRRRKRIPPKFYTIPHNKLAEEGDTVRFQCAVIGDPSCSTCWDKNGVPLTSTETVLIQEQNDLRILQISNVTFKDEGLYRIMIENELGQSEATARLDIINSRRKQGHGIETKTYEKHFGRHNIGKVATVNDKCVISCNIPDTSINGSATWYKNGETLQTSENIISKYCENAFQLQFNQLTLNDSGLYTCILENDLGKTRCIVELIVLNDHYSSNMELQPPVFVVGIPRKSCILEGQSFQFCVKLQGASPIHVIWSKNGEKLPNCNDFQYINHGQSKFSLKLNDVFIPDSGLYKCEAHNNHGDAVSAGHLLVTDATKCMDKFSLEKVVPCKNNDMAEKVDKISVSRNEDDSFLYKVNKDRNPLNKCAIENATNCDLYDNNLSSAKILEGPTNSIVLRGETVSLRTLFSGNPTPMVKWKKADRELTPNDRISISTNSRESILKLNEVTADDGGKYEIIVTNKLGVDSHIASLAVEGSPDAPNGQPNSIPGDRSATVTWCSPPYDGGSKIISYTIEMRSYLNSQWRKVVENCHSLSYTVRGLTPGESYIFRIRAENAYGLSNPSMESIPAYITHADVCYPIEQKRVNIQNSELFTNQYEVLEELGKGRYGTVHKTRDKEFGNFYAAKFVRCIKTKDKEKVREEVSIMNILKHPKLLQLIAAFENNKEIIMVTEYICGGELFERVVADDFTLTERDCILFMRQICEGVAYIHKNNIVHVDLKPENIMCVSRTSHQIKLIDFGLAQKLSPDNPIRVLSGTPEFIPPEIVNYEPIGTESDMWSVGVICYVLLSGLSPFMGDNDDETFANITRADYDFDDEAFEAISQDAKDFISSLLIKRKEKRLTAKQCLHHKWLAQHDKTMSCVKLCTDKLKKFIIRRKWQKTGNAIRALGRMVTLSAASRRSSSTNSSSCNSPTVSVSGIYSSRISSLGEDNLLSIDSYSSQDDQNSISKKCVLNNVDCKTSIDETDDKQIAPKSPSKNSHKIVVFKEIYPTDIIPITNSEIDGSDSKYIMNNLNDLLEKSEKVASDYGQSSCNNLENEKIDSNSSFEPSNVQSCVISKINNETDLKKNNSKFETLPKCKFNFNSNITGINDKRPYSTNKDLLNSEDIRHADEGNINKLSTPFVEKEFSKHIPNPNKINKKLVNFVNNVNSKGIVTSNLSNTNITLNKKEINLNKTTNGANEICKLSNIAKINTAERLKKFEQISSNPSCTSKIKKETFVSNKTNFQKAVAFWNRE